MARSVIRRLLIANRGEIAIRIARGAREAGISPVGVYSDADANAAFREALDESVRIGPGPATESYLDGAAIIVAARTLGADAVHPGYGFLSSVPRRPRSTRWAQRAKPNGACARRASPSLRATTATIKTLPCYGAKPRRSARRS